MNDTPPITYVSWSWFWFQTILIGLLAFTVLVVRLVMIEILLQQFGSRKLPFITEWMILGDPVEFISMGSIILIILTTVIGPVFFLKNHAKGTYISQMPTFAAMCGLLYLALLIMAFLTPFIEIVVSLNNVEMPSGYPVSHQVPALKPHIAPGYWLCGSLLYLLIVSATIWMCQKKRQFKLTTSA